jgi:hypothetical protein
MMDKQWIKRRPWFILYGGSSVEELRPGLWREVMPVFTRAIGLVSVFFAVFCFLPNSLYLLPKYDL